MFYFLIGFITWLGLIEPSRSGEALVAMTSTVYKVIDEEQLPIDLFLPATAQEPTPIVLFVHGGGWFLRNKLDYHDYAAVLAMNGMAAATIEWRRVPPDGFRDQVADIKDAIRWLRTHAEEYNIDPDRIGIYGSSSGGHLAGLTAFAGNGEGFGDDDPEGPSSAVQAAFLHEGIYDLTVTISVPEDIIYQAYLNGESRLENPAAYAANSPLFLIDGSEPPVHISYGSEDVAVPIDQPERLERALVDAGVSVERFVLDGLSHGFIFFRPWTRPIMMERLLEYMRETL